MADRLTRVLLVYEKENPSVLLCARIPFTELAKVGRIKFKACTQWHITKEQCSWADVLVFVRANGYFIKKLSQKMKRLGKHLLYVLDDDLLSVPEYLTGAARYTDPAAKKNMIGIMAACNTLLSPSPALLEKYGAGFTKCVLIDEPAVRHIAYQRKKESAPIRIGFSGSTDRVLDVESMLKNVVERLQSVYGSKISIAFFGIEPNFAKESEMVILPYAESYDEYLKTMHSLHWDIGLAPLPDTPFHSCKYFNKYVEYAASGTVGVYSRVSPYTRIIEEGKNGLYTENDDDGWISALSRLIEDDSLRERLREQCCRDVAERFSPRSVAEKMAEAMGTSIMSYRAPTKKSSAILWMKIVGVASHTLYILRIHKGSVFIKLWKKIRQKG